MSKEGEPEDKKWKPNKIERAAGLVSVLWLLFSVVNYSQKVQRISLEQANNYETEKLRLIRELTYPDETLMTLEEASVSEQQMRMFNSVRSLFREAGVNFEYEISNRAESPVSHVHTDTGMIHIQLENLQLSTEELRVVVFHEAFHMLDRLLLRDAGSQNNRLHEINQNYIRLYERFVDLESSRVARINGTPSDASETENRSTYGAFRIFDESHYLCRQEEPRFCIGHPYDNHREFFASTLGVMKLYPEQFISYFDEFMDNDGYSIQQREMARALILSTMNAFEASLNGNNQAIRALVPKFHRIRRHVERREAVGYVTFPGTLQEFVESTSGRE